jgi:hypothetical protein
VKSQEVVHPGRLCDVGGCESTITAEKEARMDIKSDLDGHRAILGRDDIETTGTEVLRVEIARVLGVVRDEEYGLWFR